MFYHNQYLKKRMDSLFLLQFACFIFMLINAFIVALSHLHVRWENKRYERSRWMIVAALIGLAIQYVLQMTFGFRAMHDNLGAVINILLYTPCFSLISIGIYNIETTRANLRKMILMCSGIYAAIIVVFCVGICLHHSLYIREGLYLMLTLFCVSVFYCIYMIIQEMMRRRNMLETMAATDMLPYVRYSRASVIILWLAVLAMPVAIFSTTLLYIVGPAVLLALLFFNLTFIALGSSYIPTEYSIICMFRKLFENILPFFEIIFVLLQAYLLVLLKFRMWFKYGLKAQKLLAQGIALGIMAISKAPCKGKSFVYCQVFESFCPYRATVLRP